jgi:hypothetical protein
MRNKRGNPDFQWIFQWFVAPESSPHTLEKSIENPDVLFCSAFQNLRLVEHKVRIETALDMESTLSRQGSFGLP